MSQFCLCTNVVLVLCWISGNVFSQHSLSGFRKYECFVHVICYHKIVSLLSGSTSRTQSTTLRHKVIHRLQDGSIPFNRNWTEYKKGFGFLSQEFWIGNDKLSFITNQNTYELRIDVTSVGDLSFFVTYSKFRISDEYGEYKLTSVGEYSGPEVCEERNNVLQCYCNEGYIGDGVNCTIDTPPSDCKDIYDRVSTESGVYTIKPTIWQGDPFDVYCNMSDGGGWTVFQRRVNGSQDFFLYWSDYKVGFGTPDHELWLGNDRLHSLTSQGNNQLRIDFVNKFGDPYYATYSSFSISDESDNYRLSVGGYSGTSGDRLIQSNNGQAFTTRDRDNDHHSVVNCASYYYWNCEGFHYPVNGAWWYDGCGATFLNSPYTSGTFSWKDLPGSYCFIKFTEMKVRRV
ncbi:Ficolin-1 [Holothuria leucospilota]|uniref:Ficolin-1 n=1 Tax=Holothuria leucospilota TaxID=206669 RepID=A0A9Q1BWR5_HOLLE|nr:Ficolin-1 [Holothuria leucospilota]